MTELERYQPKSSLELAPEAWGLAQRIAQTDFVPSALRGKPEAVLACILAGHEVGVSPMQSLSKIHVIDGRPAMAAELMRALILRAGHEIWIEESSATRCLVGGSRKGSSRQTRMTWTIDDAQRAGLKGRKNWQSYPTAMLLARATAALCRAIFPDVLAGISYALEELEDGDLLDAEAPTVEGPAAPAQPRRRLRAPQAATRGSDAPEVTEPDPEPKAEREQAPLPGEEGPEIIDTTARVSAPADFDEIPPVGEGEPPAGDYNYEGRDAELRGRSYSGPQIIAIKLGEFGISTRPDRLAAISKILGREIESSKHLSTEEIQTVIRHLNDLPEGSIILEEAREEEAPAPEPEPEPEPEEAPATSTSRRRRAPAVEPEQWDAGRWRAFLGDRGVKVTELLKEAARIARDTSSSPVATVDDIAGSGIATDLVGFVEDLALERKSADK